VRIDMRSRALRLALAAAVLWLAAALGAQTRLFAYVGAGIREPVAAMAEEYQKRTGVVIEMTFNNMGSLLSQLLLAKTGDLFIPGGMSFVRKAQAAGLIAEIGEPMAYHVPAIVVPKSNPAKVASIADLAKPGVRLVLPDRKATALGISAFEVFDKLGIAGAVEKNVLGFLETPDKVLVAIEMGQGDAGIVDYNVTFRDRDKVSVIDIDPAVNEVEKIPCTVLSCSSDRAAAAAFLRFAEREGPAFFAKSGFKVEP